MKGNSEQAKETPAPKAGMSDFRKAMIWTAIPLAVLGIVAVVGMVPVPGYTWGGFAAWALFGLAILAFIGFGIAEKIQIALGILAGLGIGIGIIIVAFGITFFVVLSQL
jgi:hypothetical protein